MKFKPGLPEGNVNVSHNSPVKEFILLLSGISAILLSVYLVLGLFIDTAVEYISPELEARIFKPLSYGSSEHQSKSSNKQEALQVLVNNLQQCTDLPYPLQVNLVESDTPNAFAFPGGKIVVFSSLIDAVQSENGLAFVLAHELSHFQNRDHLRGMGRSIVFTALMSAVTGAGSDLTRLVSPVTGFSQAQYSQRRETMADEQALTILNCYYGHVGGAAEFFETMAPLTDDAKSPISHYFSSHPEAQHRIANLQRIADNHHLLRNTVRPLSPVFSQ